MMTTTTTTHTLTVAGVGPVDVTIDDRGEGRPVLLLHGGGGPQSVAGFAALLSGVEPARVITPTHPGFGGTPRPDALHSIAGLAALYAALLAELDLRDVTVVGNSIGGWIAAELALRDPARLGGLALVDAVGIEVPGHPVADFFSLTMDQVAQLSYHDPATFRAYAATLSETQRAAMATNRAALAVYAGTSMADPTLAGRLARIAVPALVLWGDSDRIVDPDYGRAYATAIPGARFQLLQATGHLPQIETPDQLLNPIWDFAATHALSRPTH
jgi:pimeloyl-ACP methyl ester carboxylesterase